MKTKQKQQPEIGRNAPCWCGSGKKFKHCHQREEQAWQADQLRLNEAHDRLVPKIIEAARACPTSVVAAMGRFWNGKYTAEQLVDLDELEPRGAERFLTWFAFDAVQDDGLTLVETLARAAMANEFDGDAYEVRLLQDWQTARLGPYRVEQVIPGAGVVMRDLLNNNNTYEVKDHGASQRLERGEVVVGHLLQLGTNDYRSPSLPRFVVGGAAAQLTTDTQERLLSLASHVLADMQQNNPDATWADLTRQRSEIFNHVIMGLSSDN